MPHLRFDVTVHVSPEERRTFADLVAETFAEVMETGTDHVGVVVTESNPSLGVSSPDADGGSVEGGPAHENVALVNADVREGRTTRQRHELARRLSDELETRLDIPFHNCYVVFTEHAGENFVLGGKPLTSWGVDEARGTTSTDC